MTAVLAHPAVVVAADKKSSSAADFLLPLILLLAIVMIFTMSRRNRRRATQIAEAAMQPGAEIVTRSGMLGTVVHVAPEEITIEVASGVHIKMLPGAVLRRDDPSLQRNRGLGGARRPAGPTAGPTRDTHETIEDEGSSSPDHKNSGSS